MPKVVADHTANPAFVAADLLSQAEHGVDSQVVLVAVNLKDEHLTEIEQQVEKQALALERVDIIRQSIPKSNIVKVKTVDEAMSFSNDYAPEHLILHLEDPQAQISKVENAGSVFVGAYTPERSASYPHRTTCLLNGSHIAVETMPQERTIPCPPTDTLANSVASTQHPSRRVSLHRKFHLLVSLTSGPSLRLWPIAKVLEPTPTPFVSAWPHCKSKPHR